MDRPLDNEDQLIERIARAVPSSRARCAASHDEVRLGIGDDAAIVAPNRTTEWVLSCDAFLEGVHFLAGSYPADSVGYKALVRAASDLAAMGARPRLFLSDACAAGKAHREVARRVSAGHGAGGSSAGDAPRRRRHDQEPHGLDQHHGARRSGSRSGRAAVRCAAGRHSICERKARAGAVGPRDDAVRAATNASASDRRLLQPHLYPKIRIELGEWLARRKMASAMMDISDGLSTDLARLCAASGVGARLWAERIPRVKIPAARTGLLRKRRLDPLQMALHGGEDYELLFTVPRKNVKRLRSAPGFAETHGHRRNRTRQADHARRRRWPRQTSRSGRVGSLPRRIDERSLLP